MGNRLAKTISWAAKALGTILDLRDLYGIFGISGGSGVMGVVIAFIRGCPLWIIVAIALGILLITLFLLTLRKKRPYYDNIKRIPRILYEMHERTKALALGKGAKIVGSKEEESLQISKDIAAIMGMGNKQLEKYSDVNNKLGKRKEKAILDYATRSCMSGLTVATMMEQKGIGLKQLCYKDFRYNFYKEQLNTLRPMPTKLINNEVDNFLEISYEYNSLLMFQKPLLSTIDKLFSPEVSVANWQLMGIFEREANKILASIKEHIGDYVVGIEKDGANRK